jgi:hypothetical protein
MIYVLADPAALGSDSMGWVGFLVNLRDDVSFHLPRK